MINLATLDSKQSAVTDTFGPVVGEALNSFETAQLKYETEDWSDWFDLPIRLRFSNNSMVSIAWSKFDDLWLAKDSSTHFSMDGFEHRWLTNAVSLLAPALNQHLRGVRIGRGFMTFGHLKPEIWTRLLLEFDHGYAEIFNALDVNAFAFHEKMPEGEFIKCL